MKEKNSTFQKLISIIKVARKNHLFLEILYNWSVEESIKMHLEKKHDCLRFPTIDFMELLQQDEEQIKPYSFLQGTSLITDIALLKSLARKFKNCIYLEIGSWRGESLANVAEVASKCYSITLSPDEIRKAGYSENFVKVHGIFSKKLHNVTVIEQDSTKFDFSSLKQKFDLIFIDGDHSYNAIKKDTENAFSVLKDENSIIVWHDYSNQIEDVRFSTLAAILDGAPEEAKKHIYHVSNTLSAIYIRRKFPIHYIEFPTVPNKTYCIDLKMEKLIS